MNVDRVHVDHVQTWSCGDKIIILTGYDEISNTGIQQDASCDCIERPLCSQRRLAATMI